MGIRNEIEKPVDVPEDVILPIHGTNTQCSQACPRVFEMITEVRDDLLQAKTNEV